jgi:hypothetical protein
MLAFGNEPVEERCRTPVDSLPVSRAGLENHRPYVIQRHRVLTLTSRETIGAPPWPENPKQNPVRRVQRIPVLVIADRLRHVTLITVAADEGKERARPLPRSPRRLHRPREVPAPRMDPGAPCRGHPPPADQGDAAYVRDVGDRGRRRALVSRPHHGHERP